MTQKIITRKQPLIIGKIGTRTIFYLGDSKENLALFEIDDNVNKVVNATEGKLLAQILKFVDPNSIKFIDNRLNKLKPKLGF